MSMWWYRSESNTIGPVKAADLRSLGQRGVITARTQVSPDNRRWVEARQVNGLLNATDGNAEVEPYPVQDDDQEEAGQAAAIAVASRDLGQDAANTVDSASSFRPMHGPPPVAIAKRAAPGQPDPVLPAFTPAPTPQPNDPSYYTLLKVYAWCLRGIGWIGAIVTSVVAIVARNATAGQVSHEITGTIILFGVAGWLFCFMMHVVAAFALVFVDIGRQLRAIRYTSSG